MSVALSTQGAHRDVSWLRRLLRVKDLLTAQLVKYESASKRRIRPMSKISDHDEFSTHAVPLAERVTAFRVAAIASMVSFSLPTFIAGIEVSAGVGSELAYPVSPVGRYFYLGATMSL